MASLTAYFKTVPKAADGDASKPSVSASPAKATAASRKRKSTTEADRSKSEEGESEAVPASAAVAPAASPAAASSSSPSASPDSANADAKRQKLEGLAGLIPEPWLHVLAPELKKPYWPSIEKFLKEQDSKKVQVFPPRDQTFRALDLCPFDKVRVVIIGQDPYHDVGQAEGLCFSVPLGVKIPSSLNNIYKELKTDLGEKNFTKPTHGNLVKWANQGVLLLNTGLTVKAHEANSHKSVGWHHFTDAIIKALAKERRGVVFLLWGAHAQAKAQLIDAARHHVLKAAHPSGLSASKGFFGCKHFSKTNELLKKEGFDSITWQV